MKDYLPEEIKVRNQTIEINFEIPFRNWSFQNGLFPNGPFPTHQTMRNQLFSGELMISNDWTP